MLVSALVRIATRGGPRASSFCRRRVAYTGTAKLLHWLISGAQFAFAWTMPHIGRDTAVTALGLGDLDIASLSLRLESFPGRPHGPAGALVALLLAACGASAWLA